MWDFLKQGGPVMVPMVIASIVAVAFIIERSWTLRWKKVIPEEIIKALENVSNPNAIEMIKLECARHPSVFADLTNTALEHLIWPKSENIDALETQARHEVMKLEKYLVVLEIIVGIAPLLGLLGTLHGLIRLFSGMGAAGLGADNARIAEGIAITLNTTFMGLLIAIPALVAWSYFNKKVESLAVEMAMQLERFLRVHYRSKKKA